MSSPSQLALSLDPLFVCPKAFKPCFLTLGHGPALFLRRKLAPVHSSGVNSRRRRVCQAVLGYGATYLDFIHSFHRSTARPHSLHTVPMCLWSDRHSFLQSLRGMSRLNRIQTLGVIRWVYRTRPDILQPWLKCWASCRADLDPFSVFMHALIPKVTSDLADDLLVIPSEDSVLRMEWRDGFRQWREIMEKESWLQKEQFYSIKAEEFQRPNEQDAFVKMHRTTRAHHSSIMEPALPLIIARSASDVSVNSFEHLGFRAPTLEELLTALAREQADVVSLLQDDPTRISWAQSIRGWSSTNEMRENPRAVLEFEAMAASELSLAGQIDPPSFVIYRDWYTRYTKRSHTLRYIQFAEAGFFSLFHIDYLGTSQYFHILKGAKHMSMLKPTPENIAKITTVDNFGNHVRDGTKTFDWVMKECVHFARIVEGQTLIMPGGWIHAVYTPVNSVVISGNFLHDNSLPEQIQCWRMNAKDKDGNRQMATVVCLASSAGRDLADRVKSGKDTPPLAHLRLLRDFLREVALDSLWTDVHLLLQNHEKKQLANAIIKLDSLQLD